VKNIRSCFTGVVVLLKKVRAAIIALLYPVFAFVVAGVLFVVMFIMAVKNQVEGRAYGKRKVE
jgi:hypothetical protein